MQEKPYRHFLFIFIQLGIWISYLIPANLLRLLGKGLGNYLCFILLKERKRVMNHLQIAFKDTLSSVERKKKTYAIFRHVALIVVEMLILMRRSPERLLEETTIREEDKRYVDALMAENKGLIIATGHFGNWEMFGGFLNLTFCHHYPLHVVARKIYFNRYNQLLLKFREKFSVETIYRDESFRGIVRHLKRGGMLGILTDQDIPSVPGIFVDFFGEPAYTSDAPARLAQISGAPILPTFFVREGGRHQMVIREAIRADKNADKTEEAKRITQELARYTEEMIHQEPEQWVWMHRRWHTKPNNQQTVNSDSVTQ